MPANLPPAAPNPSFYSFTPSRETPS
ncbi:hypothetical protein SMAC4_14152 [Sordaria macrospora]|nr:hypothetical protein SMAC4_14152 [Sordaria macrospora]